MQLIRALETQARICNLADSVWVLPLLALPSLFSNHNYQQCNVVRLTIIARLYCASTAGGSKGRCVICFTDDVNCVDVFRLWLLFYDQYFPIKAFQHSKMNSMNVKCLCGLRNSAALFSQHIKSGFTSLDFGMA